MKLSSLLRKAACVALVLGATATAALAGDTTYVYDALGRVIEVHYPDGSAIYYSYDEAGNRTQVVKST